MREKNLCNIQKDQIYAVFYSKFFNVSDAWDIRYNERNFMDNELNQT